MTPNRITVALEKYQKHVPEEDLLQLRRALELAYDECLDEFMFLPIKKKTTTLLLSLFLGGIAADRFYLGNYGLAFSKLIFRVVSIFMSAVPILGLVMSIISGIWCFADIFLTYKETKAMNYRLLLHYLRKHEKYIEVPDSSYGKHHHSQDTENSSETNSTPRPAVEDGFSVLSAEPMSDNVDILYTCPNCSAKIQINTVASQYVCPICNNTITYKDILNR